MTATATPQDLDRTLREARASRPLTPGDFCDRCTVGRAVARATVGTRALYFCGHHLRDHREALDSTPGIILHVENVAP